MRTGIRWAATLLAGAMGAFGVAIPASAAPPTAGAIPAAGSFTVDVDFSTLDLQPLPGKRCEITADGILTFTGTLNGVTEGTTTAIVFAPCADVGTNPPGAFRDTFRFQGEFEGTVDDTVATGALDYRGVTAPGGHIRAAIHLTGDEARATLRADATIAEGGTYTGVAKLR